MIRVMRSLLLLFAELLGQRTRFRAAIKADAERMIARFHDQAYLEARDRVKGRCVDGPGTARHWIRVKREVARRQGICIGLTGADARR